MKHYLSMAALLWLSVTTLFAQDDKTNEVNLAGTFSLGTRNTFSMLNNDHVIGKGIGGQIRLQMSDRINTEWFLDYITSHNKTYTSRNDYDFGWSIMYYPGKEIHFDKLLQPFILAGHCFSYSKVTEQDNTVNYADRWTMAAHAGLGTHINITPRFDCSLSARYMLYFGKDIETTTENDKVIIEKEKFTTPYGHLLFSVSVNYKLFHLWNSKKI